jgi:hypothetical protein
MEEKFAQVTHTGENLMSKQKEDGHEEDRKRERERDRNMHVS